MSIREISTQAKFAGIMYSYLQKPHQASNDIIFIAIHSFLSHCAMVSKMLKATEQRNNILSRWWHRFFVQKDVFSIGVVLGVDKKSLIHKRKFRNHLEHYDERLKGWIGKYGPDTNIGTYNIGSRLAFQINNIVFVSHYDPRTMHFTFVNEDFDLAVLNQEVLRIKMLADQWVKKIENRVVLPPFG